MHSSTLRRLSIAIVVLLFCAASLSSFILALVAWPNMMFFWIFMACDAGISICGLLVIRMLIKES